MPPARARGHRVQAKAPRRANRRGRIDMRRAILAFALFVGGCTTDINQSRFNKLQVGMTRQEVITVIGNPERRETYCKTEFLVYRDDKVFRPIAIVDGKVTDWGRNYYDITVRPIGGRQF